MRSEQVDENVWERGDGEDVKVMVVEKTGGKSEVQLPSYEEVMRR